MANRLMDHQPGDGRGFRAATTTDASQTLDHESVNEVAVICADGYFELGGRTLRNNDTRPDFQGKRLSTFENGFGFVARIRSRVQFSAGRLPLWFTRDFSSRRSYIFMLEMARLSK